jgi:hypothetical protein
MENLITNKNLFISYASEDKNTFVKPLAETLRLKGLTIWYDEFEIKPGMSIRTSIDKGLLNCDIGLIVFSQHYFKKTWTKWELNGLIQKMLNGNGNLLPIWLDVDYNDVFVFSPSLTDIKAIKTSVVNVAADEIYKSVYPNGSLLEKTRNILLENNFCPPEYYSDWWLNAIGYLYADDRIKSNPHSFPFNSGFINTIEQKLAFSGLRLDWISKFSFKNLNQFSKINEIIETIKSCNGLEKIIEENVDCLVTYFPQLLLTENEFSPLLLSKDTKYCKLIKDVHYNKSTPLTIDLVKPTCNIMYSFLHDDFGNYTSRFILKHFIQGEVLGATPSKLNYWCVLIKLFDSSSKEIYTQKIINKLLDGFKNKYSIEELEKSLIEKDTFNFICSDMDSLSTIINEVKDDFNLSLTDEIETLAMRIKKFNLTNFVSDIKYERLTIPKEDKEAFFRGVTFY